MDWFDPKSKVEISEILISGNNRTKLSYFNAEFSDAINTSKNLEELHSNLHKTTRKLVGSNLFDVVDTNVDINSVSKDNYIATLKVNVKEKGIPFLKVETYVQAGKTSDIGGEIGCALRNPSGHGEIYRVSSITGAAGLKEYSASVSVPNVGEHRGHVNVTARSGEESQAAFTAFRQTINAVSADYTSRDNKHKLTAEYSLRDEIPFLAPTHNAHSGGGIEDTLSPRTPRVSSLSLLSAATSSIKSSLKYAFTAIDSRDSAVLPTGGKYLHGSVEVAVPPGGAQFVKSELKTQLHHTLGPALYGQPGLVGSLSGSIGVMMPLLKVLGQKGDTRSFLSDRYQLGGAGSLRGFDNNGIGSRAYSYDNSVNNGSTAAIVGSDALGGDTKTTFLAQLSVPVPVKSLAEHGARAFVFLNAGSLGYNNWWKSNIPSWNTAANNARNGPFFGYLRASVGGGLSIALGDVVRLETTYSIPILKSKQDLVKGFQLGLSFTVE